MVVKLVTDMYHCKNCEKYFGLLSDLQEHVRVTEHYDYELVEAVARAD